MDGIFTLPYSEFEVVNHMQKKFKRNAGYSIYIPVSRQQKGIDFIMHNSFSNKTLRFQVKSSRTYVHEAKIQRNGEIRPPKYRYYLWLNNFIDKFEKGKCDYYVLFGLYPVYKVTNNIKSDFWNSIILCYSEDEMFELLQRIKTKREQKKDKFFEYGFNTARKIFASRGLKEDEDASGFLLENRVQDIIDSIK